jgi:tetratricopeptide (TPR) repeat protein
MDKNSTSFWADIKKFEDILAKDPNSYCFAPLSELYRKLGLLDDAIGVAQRGTDVHPEYVGGYMALGRAYFEKGMREKSKEALERVAKATPENLLAQKLLFQIYNDEGNTSAAERALQLLVSFNPEDVESRLMLESIRKSVSSTEDLVSVPTMADEISGEAQTVALPEEELAPVTTCLPASGIDTDAEFTEIIDSEETFLSLDEMDEEGETTALSESFRPSPLPTLTLAELYASQGFQRQALNVYEELLREDPENVRLLERVDSLRRSLDDDSKSTITFPGDSGNGFAEEITEAVLPNNEKVVSLASLMSYEQMVLETLEDWLNSIRRVKECR